MIICAAIKDTSTGQVFYGPCHGDIYDMMRCFGYNAISDFLVEGFVDNRNNFYNRHEAFMWAQQIGPSGIIQISPCSIDSSYLTDDGRCAAGGKSCDTCRREFWSQEVE